MQEIREHVRMMLHKYHIRMKEIFDKKTKEKNFFLGDLILSGIPKGQKEESMEKLITSS